MILSFYPCYMLCARQGTGFWGYHSHRFCLWRHRDYIEGTIPVLYNKFRKESTGDNIRESSRVTRAHSALWERCLSSPARRISEISLCGMCISMKHGLEMGDLYQPHLLHHHHLERDQKSFPNRYDI